MMLLRAVIVVALTITQPFNFSPWLVSSLSSSHPNGSKEKPALASQLKNQMILAPLTRGGNLPFRRLCGDFGMKVSISEMVYARFLLQGDPIERARMRRASNEECFGVQIATNDAAEGRAAMKLAQLAGADFVDLNCGCPIHEATRRGLGSALLRSPIKVGNLVREMIADDNDNHQILPLSVKVRLGRDASSINALEIVKAVRDAGAAAVTIHGRTAIQGYSKAADWRLIQSIVKENAIFNEETTSINDNLNNGMSIVGNGDIFTHYEAQKRFEETGVDAVMVGRGALIKPWIFQEFQQQQSWEPDLSDRVSIYRRLACYMKEHFGDDEMGRKKSWNFLPWHFDFFARYIPLPDEEYLHMYTTTAAENDPLIQMRQKPSSLCDQLPPLGVLLSHRNKQAHDRIASILWESDSDSDAMSKLISFAESVEFATIQNSSDEPEETTELGNIRKERWHRRRRSNPKPQRTPEEIAIVRAERAAKKARLEMENNAANAGSSTS